VPAREIRITPQKILIIFAHRIEARTDAPVQCLLRFARALCGKGIVALNPFIHLGHRRVVLGHQLRQFLLRRVVGIHHRDRNAGVLLNQITDGQWLIRGYQRANQTDEKFVHANNISFWQHESRCKQVASGLNFSVAVSGGNAPMTAHATVHFASSLRKWPAIPSAAPRQASPAFG